MNSMTRAVVGTFAAGAMAIGSMSPAVARDRDRDRDKIDGSDILTGALIIGGIAAVAAAASRNDNRRDRYDDRRYDDRRYDDRGYNDRRYNDRRYRERYDRRGWRQDHRQHAVAMCVRAAEDVAERYTRRGRAEVFDIRDVDRERGGFEVKGRIAVQERGRSYGRDRWDEGRFTCDVRRGRAVDLDFRGIRGL